MTRPSQISSPAAPMHSPTMMDTLEAAGSRPWFRIRMTLPLQVKTYRCQADVLGKNNSGVRLSTVAAKGKCERVEYL